MRAFLREHVSILNTARLCLGHWLLGMPGERCTCRHCRAWSVVLRADAREAIEREEEAECVLIEAEGTVRQAWMSIVQCYDGCEGAAWSDLRGFGG